MVIAKRYVMSALLLFVVAAGLLGSPGFIYAADRLVVGELYSADN